MIARLCGLHVEGLACARKIKGSALASGELKGDWGI